jgi:hypothetical protein
MQAGPDAGVIILKILGAVLMAARRMMTGAKEFAYRICDLSTPVRTLQVEMPYFRRRP